MSSNEIKVNDSKELVWIIPDSDMEFVIFVLNKLTEKNRELKRVNNP